MSIEFSYGVSLDQFRKKVSDHTQNCLPNKESEGKINIADAVSLAGLTLNTLRDHHSIRKQIEEDASLPDVVRNDPPSLRATLWMVLIRDITENYKRDDPADLAYPQRLYALSRCWLNGLDDVMDNAPALPITKKHLIGNDSQDEITRALSVEFARLYRNGNPAKREKVKEVLRQYRHTRDFWVDSVNRNEFQGSDLTFESALAYNVEAMAPITFIFAETLSIDCNMPEDQKAGLKEALSLYATSGKLIDDMTDWLKDTRNGHSNLFTLVLDETGEKESLIENTKWISKLGNKAFVPISLMKLYAPKACHKYFESLDKVIGQLDECEFKSLSMSMKGVRQMMWAYALNEGLPQV